MKNRTTAQKSVLLVLAGACLQLLGCTDRLTTQEAYETCEELLGRPEIPAEETEGGEGDAVFAECVACHEDCGPACDLQGSAEPSFECPAEGEGGGG